jgi:hypothetical protein
MSRTATKVFMAILGTLPLLALVPAASASAATSAPVKTHAGSAIAATATPEFGIRFFPDGDPGQCTGPQSQWAVSPDWTTPIRFDTDSRTGGCDFAFGLYDPSSTLTGLSITYSWLVNLGGDGSQCGSQGTYQIPINTQFQGFGTLVRDDTDNRAGWCNLTFTVSGRTDIGLDVQFWADGDPNQCHGALPKGSFYTAASGSPVTIGLDTDNRVGGCWVSLRLRHFGFSPVRHINLPVHVT